MVSLLFEVDRQKKLSLNVYGLISNTEFIISNESKIERWCIGYDRPSTCHHFYILLTNHFIGEYNGACDMCFENGLCKKDENNQYCVDCINFIGNIINIYYLIILLLHLILV